MSIVARLITTFLVITLLTSCNALQPQEPTPFIPDTQATQTPGEADQAVISFASSESDRDAYIALAERFHSEHPDIKVVVIPVEDLLYAGGNQPPQDVYNPASDLRRILSGTDTVASGVVQPDLIGTPLLLDLKPLMDADAAFQRSDFYTGTLEYWSANGGIWALPRTFAQRTISYNADLFAAAGIQAPGPNWTWDDFVRINEQISQSKSYGFLDTTGGAFAAMAILENTGLDPLNPPANSRLTDDIYLKTFEQLRDLNKRNVIYNPYSFPPPNSPSASTPVADPMQLIREGKVAMWDSSMFYGSDSISFPFKIGTLSYPDTMKRSLQFMGSYSEGYVISSGTAYPQAAWAWIEFLSRQATTTNYADPNAIPARDSVAKATNYWQNKSEEQSAALRWSLEHSLKPPFRSDEYMKINGISQVSNQIMNDPKADIRQLLQTAQQDLERMLAEAPTPVPIDTSPLIVATPEPQEPAPGMTAIRFATMGYGGSELRPLLRAFQREHPDIFVKIASTNNFTREIKLDDMVQLSDCFLWYRSPTSEEASKNLLDMRPLIDADPSFARDDIPPALWSVYEHENGLYGLPYTFNVRVMNYNRTLFEQAGLPAPTADWTLEQFLQTAQALSKGEGNQRVYGFANPNNDATADLALFSQRFGTKLTRKDGITTMPNFADPKSIQAIEWYLNLDKTHHVMPPLNIPYRMSDQGNVKGEDIYSLFQKNRVAMWFDYGKNSFDSYDQTGQVISSVDVGLAPIPLGQQGLSTGDIQTTGFHITKTSQSPQACWELIKFLSGQVTLTYGSLPARKTLAQSEEYKNQAAPDRLEILKIYEPVLQRPAASGTSDIPELYFMDLYWLNKAIMEAATDKTPLQRGLEQAQQMTSSFQTCVAQGGKPPTCALQADPDYQGFNTESGAFPMLAPTAAPVR